MLDTLGPIQQLIIGLAAVGIFFTLVVIYLTSNPKFENYDRWENLFTPNKSKD